MSLATLADTARRCITVRLETPLLLGRVEDVLDARAVLLLPPMLLAQDRRWWVEGVEPKVVLLMALDGADLARVDYEKLT